MKYIDFSLKNLPPSTVDFPLKWINAKTDIPERMTKENPTLIPKDPLKGTARNNTHNVPADDVENTYGTN